MFMVKTGKNTFYLTGQSIYLLYNLQKFIIKNLDESELSPNQYAELCDMIYRRKLSTSDDIYHLFRTYKLVVSQRSLK